MANKIVGTPEVGATNEADITPSRRSSRKKQSTFSSDFEYYTPTGRKVEKEETQITPLSEPIGKPKEDHHEESDEDEEGEEEEESEEESQVEKKTIVKNKGAQKKIKGKVSAKGEKGRGKPKTAAKKKGKAIPVKKKKLSVTKQRKNKASSDEDDDDDEDEEEDEEDQSPEVSPTKKRKIAVKKPLSKKAVSPKKCVGITKNKKVKEETSTSSSDEEDSKPISQLQAQLKKEKALKDRVSPLAQNLAARLTEAKSEGGPSGAESKKLTLSGAKRKADEKTVGKNDEPPVKKFEKSAQIKKFGNAFASLVKRIPPADLGLIKRTPSEIAAKTVKPSATSPDAAKDSIKQDITSEPNGTGVKKEADTVSSVKSGVRLKTEAEDYARKSKDSKKASGTDASREHGVQAELSEASADDVKVKSEPSIVKATQPSTFYGKNKLNNKSNDPPLKTESATNKNQPDKSTPHRKLTDGEIRQKKIEEIKAKIAERSAGSKLSNLEKRTLIRKELGKSSKPLSAKETPEKVGKDSEVREKKIQEKSISDLSPGKNKSNLPPHLLKKLRKKSGKLEKKGQGKLSDVSSKGVLHKKKSHQPFGNKNVVVRKSTEKSPNKNSENGSDQGVKADEVSSGKGYKNSDKVLKNAGKINKEIGQKKRKSSDSQVETGEKVKERKKSLEGKKKETKKGSVGEKVDNKMCDQKEDPDGPPLLLPASSVPLASKNKHKHHKPEHEVPLDMSMNDLFKPDGLIVHETTEAPPATTATDGQDEDASTVEPSKSDEAQNILLEHQYSKPSSPAAGVASDSNIAGASVSKGIGTGDMDIESVSHHRSVLMDANLPEQILEEADDEPDESQEEHSPTVSQTSTGQGKYESSSTRTSILDTLSNEIEEAGTDFIIVGQVQVPRQRGAPEPTTPLAKEQSKREERTPTESIKSKREQRTPSSDSKVAVRKRRDSEKSSESERKKSTDSKSPTSEKKKKQKDDKTKSKTKTKKKKKTGKGNEEEDEEMESGDEEEEEDFEDDEEDIDWEDPDTLYCLCRKPHNMRFMICCDKCEEWYHGSCIGVTRARGKEMEDNEEEYICPICIKGDGVSVLEKSTASSSAHSDKASPSKPVQPKCVGRKCNKTPRSGSVYCSNECIMNHAQESLKTIRDEQAKKLEKEKELSSSKKSPSSSKHSSSKSSSDCVEVIERETGKILKGSEAPTQKGLTRWLEQHPTFEVVQESKHRSSSSRDSRDSRDEKHKHSSSSSSSKDRKSDKGTEDKSRHHHHHSSSSSASSSSRRDSVGHKSSSSRDHHSSSSSSSAKKIDSDRRRSSSSSNTSSHRKDKEESDIARRGDLPHTKLNQVRVNVCTALSDSLSLRSKGADDITMPNEDIKALAAVIEQELYDLFDETGHKYRAKYRSLVFNIKDQKNKGLFRKILNGKIKPDQLVLMSTEDLASQELAKWREQESKHQLEMIEKLEKEKQSTKSINHVTKKTHKGEVEVEDEDLTILETRLEQKKAEDDAEKQEEEDQDPALDTTSQHRAHLFDMNCKVCTGKIVPGPEEQAKISQKPKSLKKPGVTFCLQPEINQFEDDPIDETPNKTDDEMDDNNHISSSTSDDWGHGKDEEHQEEDEEDRWTKKEREKEAEDEIREEEYTKAAEIVKEALEHVHEHEQEMSSLPCMVDSPPNYESLPSPESPKEEPPDVDLDSIDDDIINEKDKKKEESKKQATSLPFPPPLTSASDVSTSSTTVDHSTSDSTASYSPTAKEALPSTRVSSAVADTKVVVRSPDSPLQSGLDLKAKFTPTGPVLWKGFVSMQDVAKFFTAAYRVSGPTDHISIQDTIHVMGRISPDHMWDYLSKIRQAGSKDITILRFIPGNDEEKVAYIHLYSYLNSRSRCGVANNPTKQIKDFYVVPLASHSKIPRTLLPFDGPGLEQNRPHMLIGILVRQKEKGSKDGLQSLSADSSPKTSTKSSRKSSSGKNGKHGGKDGGKAGKDKSSRSSIPSVAGASRDPRLARLVAKVSSESGQSPSSSSSSKEVNSSDPSMEVEMEDDEYDPEFVPVSGKPIGVPASQSVAEYIPTPNLKNQESKDDEDGLSKSLSSENTPIVDSVKDKHHHRHHQHKDHHHHHKDHHHHQHSHHEHHHQSSHHSHHHHKKIEEDDSEPYSPGKEAEPYSPGQEAAAEEPYDPEDESLMDEDGHPIITSTTLATTGVSSSSAKPVTQNSTSAISGLASAEASKESKDELVEQMARSNDPSQISALMVQALSHANTQDEQQKLLVSLTKKVEDRKLHLAEVARLTVVSQQTKQTPPVETVADRDIPTGHSEDTQPDGRSKLSLNAEGVDSSKVTSSSTESGVEQSVGGGIKFSIRKSSDKSSLKNLGSSLFTADTSSKSLDATPASVLQVQSQSKSAVERKADKYEEKDEKEQSQLPDALKALMNDVMGNTQGMSLERRSMLLMKKQESDRNIKEEKEMDKGKGQTITKDIIGEEKKKQVDTESALNEAQKRDEDEEEARKILDSMKNKPMNEKMQSSVEPEISKPTKAPSIDELLERLKKGGFQFPLQPHQEEKHEIQTDDGSRKSNESSSSDSKNNGKPLSSTTSSVSLSSIVTAVSSIKQTMTTSSSSTSSMTTAPHVPINPSVPTYTSTRPHFNLPVSTSTLLSSSEDTDLRVSNKSHHSNKLTTTKSSTDTSAVNSTSIGFSSEDRDERPKYSRPLKSDRDDRPYRSAAPPQSSGPKNPLDPHAFPPLPGMFPPPSRPAPLPAEYPSYQPTPRSILPQPKARSQPLPPGTEFEKPAEVLGITDIDLRRTPSVPPPLPPQPPPPLPPLPHQFHEDVDYRSRSSHHVSSYGRGGGARPFHRH